MKTIRWKKEEYIDIGNGFTAIIETATTIDGLVMKAYLFKDPDEDKAVLLTSVLSQSYDVTYLYSLVFRILNDPRKCEKLWWIKNKGE